MHGSSIRRAAIASTCARCSWLYTGKTRCHLLQRHSKPAPSADAAGQMDSSSCTAQDAPGGHDLVCSLEVHQLLESSLLLVDARLLLIHLMPCAAARVHA